MISGRKLLFPSDARFPSQLHEGTEQLSASSSGRSYVGLTGFEEKTADFRIRCTFYESVNISTPLKPFLPEFVSADSVVRGYYMPS
jgi:hypothetical protein